MFLQGVKCALSPRNTDDRDDSQVFGARKLVFPPFIPPPPPNTIRFRPPLPTSLPPIGLDGDDDFDDDFDDLSPYTYATSLEAKKHETGKKLEGKEEHKMAERDFIDMDEDPMWVSGNRETFFIFRAQLFFVWLLFF